MLKKTSAATIAAAVPSRPSPPSGPDGAISCRNATPDDDGRAARTAPRPAPAAGRGRGSAAGAARTRPGARRPPRQRSRSAADHRVNHSTRCTRGRPSTSSTPPGSKDPSGQRPAREHPGDRIDEEHGERGQRDRGERHGRPGPVRRRGRARSRTRRHWLVMSRHSRSHSPRLAGDLVGGPPSGASARSWRTSPTTRAAATRAVDRVDVHVVGQRRLEVRSSMKSMNFFMPSGFSEPFEHAGVLHLAEAGVEQRAASSAWSRPRGW